MATKDKETLEEKKDKGLGERQDQSQKGDDKDKLERQEKDTQDKGHRKDDKEEGGCCGG